MQNVCVEIWNEYGKHIEVYIEMPKYMSKRVMEREAKKRALQKIAFEIVIVEPEPGS